MRNCPCYVFEIFNEQQSIYLLVPVLYANVLLVALPPTAEIQLLSITSERTNFAAHEVEVLEL